MKLSTEFSLHIVFLLPNSQMLQIITNGSLQIFQLLKKCMQPIVIKLNSPNFFSSESCRAKFGLLQFHGVFQYQNLDSLLQIGVLINIHQFCSSIYR